MDFVTSDDDEVLTMTRITRNGQITLTTDVRREMNVDIGDFVRIKRDSEGRIYLVPVDLVERD